MIERGHQVLCQRSIPLVSLDSSTFRTSTAEAYKTQHAHLSEELPSSTILDSSGSEPSS